MKRLLALAVVVPALIACKPGEGKSDKAATKATESTKAAEAPTPPEPAKAAEAPTVAAVPCDPAFAKKISTANGFNLDRSKPEVQKMIDDAKAEVTGKTFAFSNCYFASQGNDEVSFKATADASDDVDCVMKGGEAGNEAFRNAAMKFDTAKLRLDVKGTVKEKGELRFLALVDCEITPHE